MKIVFMGTPEIAVPTLDKLLKNGMSVSLVVCQPDKPKGRGNKLQPPPVKEYAIANNLEVFQPEKIKNNTDAIEKIKSHSPDFIVVAAYGKILPKELLEIPKYAPVNVHFSLLPKYRGAAPVNWAIINGESETGVTTMKMDEGLDTGDILLVRKEPISPEDTTVTLSERLAEIGGDLLVETLKNYSNITPKPQDHSNFTYAPIIKKEDGKIDFKKPAIIIERMIRGFTPWPTAYSHFKGKMVKFFSASVSDKKGEAGTIIEVNKDSFTVACGEGALRILELQFEGKNRMDTKSFLSGFKVNIGEIFE
ncbi:MAG: methionyl-tRNA formyltransferase [Calditerrivibrio sp.]|nr:methionyl-tRNA formyltransferase [Calditerrivibrio sp.]MCA1981115.1 methionyl-tRNA formyltransferase [Calditerrivibrio sp.]